MNKVPPCTRHNNKNMSIAQLSQMYKKALINYDISLPYSCVRNHGAAVKSVTQGADAPVSLAGTKHKCSVRPYAFKPFSAIS
jgi:hypothetical protein